MAYKQQQPKEDNSSLSIFNGLDFNHECLKSEMKTGNQFDHQVALNGWLIIIMD